MERSAGGRVLALSQGSACREFLTRWAPERGYGHGHVPDNCSIMRFAYQDGDFLLEDVLEQQDFAVALGEELQVDATRSPGGRTGTVPVRPPGVTADCTPATPAHTVGHGGVATSR